MKEGNFKHKGGHGRCTKTNTEERKLRNRLSQKAFRARQAIRIKELEQRLKSRPVSETERVSELEDRNAFLCNRLFESHKKIASLQVTLKALMDSIAETLDLVVSTKMRKIERDLLNFGLSKMTDFSV